MDDVTSGELATPTLSPKQQQVRRRLGQRPVDEDYRKVDRLVHAVCHWFHTSHPQHRYEDLYEVAAEAAVVARADFNPTRGSKLGTWVWNKVRYALLSFHSGWGRDGGRCRDFSNLEDVTAGIQDSEGLPVGVTAGPDQVPDRPRFAPDRFLSELSEDAATVVRLVWDRFAGDPSQIGRREARGALARALDELKWAASRFMAAVTEVRESLT